MTVLVLLRVLLLIFFLATSTAGHARPPPPTRVLFVGNSHTLTNNLPRLVAKLAKERGVALAVETLAEPDHSLADHLAQPRLKRLLQRDWDWVILQQGPSSLTTSRAELIHSTQLIAKALRGRSTRIALMSVWPQRTYQASSLAAEGSYRQAASAVGGCVLPVASAWRLALEAEPSIKLYKRDQLHATRAGSSLAAFTVVLGVLGESGSEPLTPSDSKGTSTSRSLKIWALDAHRGESQRCDDTLANLP